MRFASPDPAFAVRCAIFLHRNSPAMRSHLLPVLAPTILLHAVASANTSTLEYDLYRPPKQGLDDFGD